MMIPNSIHIHDFSGHPFQFDLSLALASRGITIFHSYNPDFETGKSNFKVADSTLPLNTIPLSLKRIFPKYALLQRIRYEVYYALKLYGTHRKLNCDLLIISNLPLISSFIFSVMPYKTKYLLWHQDIYSEAMPLVINGNHKSLKRIIHGVARFLEGIVAKRALGIISISTNFADCYKKWGLDNSKITYMPNWSSKNDFYPIDQEQINTFPLVFKPNQRIFVYAGTLGLKHNSQLLIHLSSKLFQIDENIILLVISSKSSIDSFRKLIPEKNNFALWEFLPIEILPHIFSRSEWGIVILEETAGKFSVPSKTLSYIASGLPVIGFMPSSNEAARIIKDSYGRVFEPSKMGVEKAFDFLDDSSLSKISLSRDKCLEYAKLNFDVNKKADQVLQFISQS